MCRIRYFPTENLVFRIKKIFWITYLLYNMSWEMHCSLESYLDNVFPHRKCINMMHVHLIFFDNT